MNHINNFVIYVQICVNKLNIYLTVLDNLNLTYYGELQFTYFENLSKQLEVSLDDCKTESISALTSLNGLPHFEYKFDDFASRFVWIKKVRGCPFGLLYGVVEMVPSKKAATAMLYFNLQNNLLKH